MNILQMKDTMTHFPLFFLISFFSLFVQEKIFAKTRMDEDDSFVIIAEFPLNERMEVKNEL